MREQPFLPRRQSVRLPTFDYSRPATYFLTICTQDKRRLFGHVSAHAVTLNSVGRIADECWLAIPRHFPNAELRPYVVMPNHLHGIIRLLPRGTDGALVAKHPRRAQRAAPLRLDATVPIEDTHRPIAILANSIPAIVRSFKSAASKRIREALGKPTFHVWQRSYYEHVVRNEDDFQNICEYIRMNPARWEFDEENS